MIEYFGVLTVGEHHSLAMNLCGVDVDPDSSGPQHLVDTHDVMVQVLNATAVEDAHHCVPLILVLPVERYEPPKRQVVVVRVIDRGARECGGSVSRLFSCAVVEVEDMWVDR